MVKNFLNVCLLVSFIGPVPAIHAQHEAFQNMPLSRITPEGWQRNFLLKQREGLTGHLDTICEPFSQNVWSGDRSGLKEPFYKRKDGKGREVLCWEPFEQTGYYYDGVLRCGLLLNDKFLLDKAYKQVRGAIAEASPEGVIGHEVPDRWGHVVFFRAFTAAYEATGDRTILEALDRHFTNDKYSLAGCRNIINIEHLVWLSGQTGKKEYLDRSVKLYEAQASRPGDRLVNKFDDLKSDERQDIHGVTFLETLKLPIILYMATGERKYLDAARNGYRKLEKWHLLANGCNSSEEGLSEKTSLSGYEMCDVSDFTWATAYMLKATGEVEWADKIERNILNAGLGAVTKEFDAHTYLSTMNQVVSALGSGQSPIMNPNSQAGVMAYCQRHMPFCCTGNATRFFPIYVGLQWLKGRDGALVKALYGPGSCVHEVAGKKVTIREESSFPFSETITLKVVEGGGVFPLLVRIPTWAKGPSVSVNGVARSGVQSGTFLTLEGEHKAGDVITLTFPREVQVRPWEMNGVVVEYGPLLFSLAIPAKVERVLLNELQWHATPADSKSLYGYNMVPDGKWNYVLALDKAGNHRAEVVENPAADLKNPWNPTNSPLAIRMYGLEMPSWTLRYQQYKPFREKEIRYAPLTPPLPPRGCMTMVTVSDFCGKPEKISLVPYGSTTLRLTVFPYWDVRDIPSFRENQLKYR